MAVNLFENEFVRFKRDGKDVSILVQRDDYPDNPRDWGNLGRMICFHNRYRLGDSHKYKSPQNFVADLVEETTSDAELCQRIKTTPRLEIVRDDKDLILLEHCKSIRGEEEIYSIASGETMDSLVRDLHSRLDELEISTLFSLLDQDKVTMLPLYLLDHSGLSMSTSSFGDPWDSGQVGWIYVTREKFLKETGYTKAQWPGRAIEMLNNEVKTYDQYLTGEVCGFTEFELSDDGEWRETDNSCWGFYGFDIEENGIVDDVPGLTEAIASGDYETGNATIHKAVSYSYEF